MSKSDPMVMELIDAAVRSRVEALGKGDAMKTLPVATYCERVNIKSDLVRKRLSTGIWQLGNQVLDVPGAGRFIDLVAVDAWVLKEGQSFLRG